MRYIPTKPSKRAIRNTLEFWSGGTAIEQAPARKTGRQKEAGVNDTIIKTFRLLFRATLFRNRRGMVQLPGGGMFPYGLGPNGFPDNVGPTPILITADMVGRTIGVFTAIEAKTEGGTVKEHQLQRIEELRDLGCIAGVARNAEDCQQIVQKWRGGG